MMGFRVGLPVLKLRDRGHIWPPSTNYDGLCGGGAICECMLVGG